MSNNLRSAREHQYSTGYGISLRRRRWWRGVRKRRRRCKSSKKLRRGQKVSVLSETWLPCLALRLLARPSIYLLSFFLSPVCIQSWEESLDHLQLRWQEDTSTIHALLQMTRQSCSRALSPEAIHKNIYIRDSSFSVSYSYHRSFHSHSFGSLG